MPATSVQLAVDRGSELPLGLQLAWRLRAGIASGRLAPGERLPSVRELADGAGVNVNTVRGVYRRLEEDGYVASRHGLGTFVAEDPPGAGTDLERLALDAAADAREAGVHPRDLAAAIYAAAEQPLLEPDSPSRISSTPLPGVAPDVDERAARRTLRRQIARLEGELAAYTRHLPAREPTHPLRLPKPHIADLAELEAIRDRLLEDLSKVRTEEARQTTRHEAAREHLEALVRAPERHKWQWVSNEDLGEPGCKYWYSRPRLGPIGAMMGWWRIKVSSGCPLAGASGGDTASDGTPDPS
jgi:DNA-binding transcriptional regulator YhcF (GntR family)